MPKSAELTQEEVFDNDKDPLAAIRELRREGGASEEVIEKIVGDDEVSLAGTVVPDDEDDGLGELGEAGKDAEAEAAAAAKEEADDKAADDKAAEEAAAATAAEEAATEKTAREEAIKLASELDESDESPEAQQVRQNATDAETTNAAQKEIDDKAAEEGKPQLRKFKANGQDFSFTQDEILAQFETVFGQAMDYTQKMQKIAPYRKMISALESEGVSSEQLNIAISALKGDTGAIQEILKLNKIDNFDLTPEDDAAPYQTTDYGKNETQLGIEEITQKIQSDPEYKMTVDIIDQQWDNDSRETIASNPQMIAGLHNDIRNGVYEVVAPAATKLKILDGNTKSDIEYYMLAGEQLRQEALKHSESENTVDSLNKQTQDVIDKSEAASSEAEAKRKAGATSSRADRKGVIDYLDDDDEKFESWYKKLQDSN